jgi:hypothetical protein
MVDDWVDRKDLHLVVESDHHLDEMLAEKLAECLAEMKVDRSA